MPLYLDHCKKALREQISSMELYISEVESLDYEFIRNQALSVFQFSDHLVSASSGSTGEKIVTVDSQFMVSAEGRTDFLREQINQLSQRSGGTEQPDYETIRILAGYVVQVCDQLLDGGRKPPSLSQRTSRCTPNG
jgi:hypothetical protein